MPFNQICQYSCGICKSKNKTYFEMIELWIYYLGEPLTCATSAVLCQNGAICTNITTKLAQNQLIGFQCLCSLGYTGQFCHIGIFNLIN